ncbi:hypothetical protein KJA15_02035 [Patescibacteria group bacterium]|nr:hypothetical protein [Patescibacteria group bacterium]
MMKQIIMSKAKSGTEDIRVYCRLLKNLLLKGKITGEVTVQQFFMDQNYLRFLKDECLPKSSIFLVNKFITNLLTQPPNMRNIVIITQLYFENIIDEIITNKFPNPKAIINFYFYNKVKIIEASGLLKTGSLNYLLFVNNIRNKFAHDIDYEIPDSDFIKIDFFKKVINRFPYKLNKYRNGRNRYTFVIMTIWYLFEIIDEHPEIYKIKK